MSSLKTGLDEIRKGLPDAREPLYQHLTDLMVALEEASGPSTSQSADSAVMDQSPSKRKLKRRRSFRGSEGPGSSGMRLGSGHPDAGMGCNSSVLQSDTSPDESARPPRMVFTTPEGTVDPGSDTDEANKFKAKATTTTSAHSRRNGGGCLKPPHLAFPAESDSYSEMMTPGFKHQRKKRLVKRMVVDSATENEMSSGRNGNVEVCVPSCSGDGVGFCLPFSGRSRGRGARRMRVQMESESSMDCDLNSQSSTSSDSDDGAATDDDGRQGDDEQSDWFFEGPAGGYAPMNSPIQTEEECMGVPAIRFALFRQGSSGMLGNCWMGGERRGEESEEKTPPGFVVESSDTDVSQGSWSLGAGHSQFPGRQDPGSRWMSKPGTPFGAAINRKLIQFMGNPSQKEYRVCQIRKEEKKELLRLATFYRLDARCESRKRRKYIVLTKTEYSRIP